MLEPDPRRRPDAAEAHRLLILAASPPRRLAAPEARGRLADHHTPHLDSLTLRLPRAVRRRRARRPLGLAAGALALAAAITAGIVIPTSAATTRARRPR
ncbi:hypothetical protein IM697_41635 [Streptomyces ferrugineus]|uniref:Uncharacterized protein n=1 Tax=Streptomyces ferrugineus TaxID=1413221 RepID=A0A7M2SJA3_9ACTN|nr:hypothetical protein [Streptomyces ferrugineus]QOV36427.1 hypothetical protein IM697_41635 [Streptomyces ferrugineus]